MSDNLFTKDEARNKMMAGVKKIADAVGSTMGTAGSNAIIEAIENPGHLMTNDGATILDAIQFADPIEDMGRKILREAVSRANKSSGDGSSTTCVLTAAILEEGAKQLGKEHPMTIKRSLEECIPLVEASINNQKRELFTDDVLNLEMLEQVATISAEDGEIGKRIAEIYSKIGKSGIIHWDVSKTTEDSYTIGQGITVEGAGYLSPYMCDANENGTSANQIRIRNPYILMLKQKLSSAADLNIIAATLNAKEVKDLVVFADDVDPLVVPDLVKTRMMRGFRIAVVKMPVLWKDMWFDDLAAATGAKVVDAAAGVLLKDANIEILGRCANIVITKDDTFLDGIQDISAYLAGIGFEDTDDAKLRASRLNTRTARYFVGAQSDSALSYRRLKVEDAISAAYQSLHGGIVAGGGIALLNAAKHLPKGETGVDILRSALLAPLSNILTNAGKYEITFGELCERPLDTVGFDTKTSTVRDMLEAGIVDPAPVVINACKNAISVAAAILTANTVVTLPREEESQPNPPVVSR